MILDKFKIRARDKTANIGIGLGDIETHNLKILFASIQFIVQNNSKVFLFGTNKSINQLSNNASYQKNENNIVLVESNEPENEIFEHLNKKKLMLLLEVLLVQANF